MDGRVRVTDFSMHTAHGRPTTTHAHTANEERNYLLIDYQRGYY